MQKVYCNICGKEVRKINEVWAIKLQTQDGNPRVSFNTDITDVCESCATVLHCCISMMPKGWIPDFHELDKQN